jgi:hydroxyacylglutathione hydrolase
MPAFTDSLRRMVAFAEAREVTHVLGRHVETTRTPGRDYPVGALYQPEEPPPQLTVDDLRAARDAAVRVAGSRGIHRFDWFIVWNRPGAAAMTRQAVRSLIGRIRRRPSL